MILVCTEADRCNFHQEGNPTEAKCPGYCEVGGCRDLVACEVVDEEADEELGLCHGHAAVWHAQRAGIEDPATNRLDTMVRDLYSSFGWQGGTVHQVKAEIARLRRDAAVAGVMARIVATFGPTDDERVRALRQAALDLKKP